MPTSVPVMTTEIFPQVADGGQGGAVQRAFLVSLAVDVVSFRSFDAAHQEPGGNRHNPHPANRVDQVEHGCLALLPGNVRGEGNAQQPDQRTQRPVSGSQQRIIPRGAGSARLVTQLVEQEVGDEVDADGGKHQKKDLGDPPPIIA